MSLKLVLNTKDKIIAQHAYIKVCKCQLSTLNPHYNSFSRSCLIETGLLGWSYGKVFVASSVAKAEHTHKHTQFSLDNLTWGKRCQTNPCLASRCTLCSTFPKTHWKTDQTMTDMSPLFHCSRLRHHWKILIEIPVVDEWCPIHPCLFFSVMHCHFSLPRAHSCWGDTYDTVVHTEIALFFSHPVNGRN